MGLAISAVGIWLFTGLTVGSTWTALLPGLLVGGVGIGLANPAIAKIALGVVPPQRAGMASGISNTFRIGGVATGVAALGAVFQHKHPGHAAGRRRRTRPRALARAIAAGGTQAAAKLSAEPADCGMAAAAPCFCERDERGRPGGRGHRGRRGRLRHAGAAQGLLLAPARRLPAPRAAPQHDLVPETVG